jgi:hypothetical protein
MAEAQFTPYLPPGGIVDAAFSGANQMQSLMDRGQMMRQRQEMADRQREIYEVGKPVMEAKAQADLALAQGTLQNAKLLQDLRGKFGGDSVAAAKELQDAMQAGDYQAITDKLSQVQQKYAYFNLLPEGKPFIDTVKEFQLQSHNDSILNRHTLSQMDIQDESHKNRMLELQTRGAQLKELYAQTGKGQTVNARDEAKAQEYEAAGDYEAANRLRSSMNQKNTPKPGPVTRSGQVARFNQAIQDADAKALEAEDQGDVELAARWHQESADQAQAKKNYLVRPAGQNPDFSHWTGGAPANPGGTGVPGTKATPAKAAPAAKLYVIDPVSKAVTLPPTMKEPKQALTAIQQALDDGVITPDAARAQLEKLGFKKKQ